MMEYHAYQAIVPLNTKGVKTDNYHTKEAATLDEAKALYIRTRQRLFNINHWNDYAGKALAAFTLVDNYGNQLNRQPQVGDFCKIDIPGPGSSTGSGFDWVQIEAMEDETNPNSDFEYAAFRVRPCTNPQNNNGNVAHFFKDDASSTYIVKREEKTVTTEIHSRNEIPNTDAEKLIDKTRNAAVGSGAIAGASKMQWKSLAKGLIETE